MDLYKYNPFAEKLNRPASAYRAVNEVAYRDLVESGVVRGRAASSVLPSTTSGGNIAKLLADRPTAFPSFERGRMLPEYLPKTGKGYVYETEWPVVRRGEVNPVTGQTVRGRHFAARPINPTTGEVLSEIPSSAVRVYEGKPHWLMGYRQVKPIVETGTDLMPVARTLGRALGEEALSAGGALLRGAGRLAGPVGVAMTAYDLAQAFPAPEPISEEEMAQAMRGYRTGPQPSTGIPYQPPINTYAPRFSMGQ